MSSELEAAARLRRVATSTFEEVYGSGPFAFNPIAEDNRIVSAAALAMGLFDSEPITDEWLLSLGFQPGRMPGDLVRSPVVRGITQLGKVHWMVRSYPIPDGTIKTRGQLRLLLKALGVEVDNKP